MTETNGDHQVEFVFSLLGREPRQMRLRLSSLACGALRVTRTLRPRFLERDSEIVLHRDPGACVTADCGDAWRVDCGSVTARVDKRSGSITFLDASGGVLLREKDRQPCEMEEKPVMIHRFRRDGAVRYTQSADGVRAEGEEESVEQDRLAYSGRLSFRFDPEEGLYGLGSHEEGYGNLRGRRRELYQHNLKAVVPLLVSTRGWGLLFDLGCLMIFHDDAEGSYLWADCADEMDYYFLPGGNARVYAAYADLTGHAPLLPRYAFGYVQSKERYKDAEELIAVAREYRRRQVPLDVIVEDWQSWPEGQWGYKTFDRGRFPDPKRMTDQLHSLGVHLMLSVWPSMQGEENEDRAEMLREDCMLGNRAVYNAFDPKARELYWRQANEGLFRYGVDAWWCDCSEPFESDWHGAVKPEPFQRVRINTEEAKRYLDPGKINLYSLYHAMGIYQGQRKTAPGKRVLNLTRSSYAGQHRYATVTWSGDVSATWETLRRQIPEGLNFMAAGEGGWTTDAGAFFPARWDGAWFGAGDFSGGVQDPGYRELYVRWLQFAAFLPMMRSHGTGTPREIWQFGEKGTPWYDAIEKIIRFRSRMIPHLYSLAAVYTASGLPMVRVPALVFPEDRALRGMDGQMMLGDQILAQPVTRPMEFLPDGVRIAAPDVSEDVYLPAGADWYAWESGEKRAGGQTVRVAAPLDTVPLFVRAGGIVLTGPDMQYVDEQKNPPLTVTVYPGADGQMIWYDDAGEGYGYERGECARVTLRWRDDAGELFLSAREGGWPGMEEAKEMRIRLAGGEAISILYTGGEQKIRLQ